VTRVNLSRASRWLMCVVVPLIGSQAVAAPETAQQGARNAAIIAAGTLQRADVPDGWSEVPYPVATRTPRIAACRALIKLQHEPGIRSHNSNLFGPSPHMANFVTAKVSIYRSSAKAARDIRQLMSSKMLRCLTQGTPLQWKASDSTANASDQLAELAVPRGGDQTRAIALTVFIRDDKGSYVPHNQIVFTRVGRVTLTTHVITFGAVDFTTVRDQIDRRLTNRIALALGRHPSAQETELAA